MLELKKHLLTLCQQSFDARGFCLSFGKICRISGEVTTSLCNLWG